MTSLVLTPYFSSAKESIDKLWQAITDNYDTTWKWNELDKADYRFITPRPAGLRWELVDFGANTGKAPSEVSESKASIALLAMALYSPEWVKGMNGDTIPYVWLGGIEVSVPGGGPWSRVPILDWGGFGREVSFGADWDGRRDSYCAVPVFREFGNSNLVAPPSQSLELPAELVINNVTYVRKAV